MTDTKAIADPHKAPRACGRCGASVPASRGACPECSEIGTATPAAWTAPPEAHEAAARIRALCTTAQTIAQLIEAQVMESLWQIRRAIPDEQAWAAFVERQTPFDADRARRMVDAWEVARKRRALRELAQRSPSTALALVGEAVAAGVDLADQTDEQVYGLMAQPPRARHRAIRELIESAAGESPGTKERIHTLEAERDDALERAARGVAPADRIRELLTSVERVERDLAGLAMDANLVLSAGAPAPAAERLIALGDQIVDAVDQITAPLVKDDDA